MLASILSPGPHRNKAGFFNTIGGKRTNGLSVFTALAALIEADHGLVRRWCSACRNVLGVAEVVDYYHMLAAVALYLEV